METEDETYNLRTKKRSRKTQKINPKNLFKRKKLIKNNIGKITKDGYINDGFVVDDDPLYSPGDENQNHEYFDIDSKPVQDDIINRISQMNSNLSPTQIKEVVNTAFTGTGKYLVQDYFGCKPTDNNWKLGLSQNDIKILEPELKRVRSMIENETPTIPKILNGNITFEDKKKCIKLFDQLNNTEPYTTQYNTITEGINNIIRKGKNHTKREIKRLEDIEKELKKIAAPPDNLKNQILTLDAPLKTMGILYGVYLEMNEHEIGSQSYNSIREELEWSVKLPYNKIITTDNYRNMKNKDLNISYNNILRKMDEKMYGMYNVKLKLLEIHNDRISNNFLSRRNIAIVGDVGVGKTQIGITWASVLGVPFQKISVGGLEDVSILKGSNKVWNNAGPSIVLSVLALMKVSNGVIMFDEMDKLSKEAQWALLHISDPTHNHEFMDSYLKRYPHDLSKVLFIYCLNDISRLDSAALDRLDIVYANPYTPDEKKIIFNEYMLPKALKNVGMKKGDIILDDKALIDISSGEDSGLRTIEKIAKSLVGKVNLYRRIILSDGTTGNINLPYNIRKFNLPIKINIKLMKELLS